MYGSNCHKKCQCLNSAECDAVTGDCLCAAGWHGISCTESELYDPIDLQDFES